MYKYIPDELKSLKNWVCWQAVPDPKPDRPDHIRKLPKDPHTGGNAKSNDPDTWGTFNECLDTLNRLPQFSGVGFMFGNSPYFGVDIDGKETELKAFAEGDNANIIGEFVHSLQSYAEYSQSGKGLHIICKGKLPTDADGKRRDSSGVEMYQNRRFFVMTGKPCAAYTDITDSTETIKPLYNKYIEVLSAPDQSKSKRAATHTGVNISRLTDDDIIDKILSSRQAAKFIALLNGDTAGYTSQSQADLALCNILAFWFNRDAARMDNIFRQSGLMRDKWDERRGAQTYGEITIYEAIAKTVETYDHRKELLMM